MLTGAPGVGGFLRQEYNSLVYSHVLLSITTIGLIGCLLDRLMGLIERKVKLAWGGDSYGMPCIAGREQVLRDTARGALDAPGY
jgi:hypothetical protein